MADEANLADETNGTDAVPELRDKSAETVPVRELGLVWAISVALSIAGFTWAINQHRIVLGSMLVIGACFFGMLSVFAVIRLLAQREPKLRTSWRLAGASLVSMAGGAAMVWWAFGREQQAVTAVGAFVLLYGGAFLADWGNQRLQPGSDAVRQTWSVMAGNTMMVLGTLVVSVEDTFTPAAAFSTAVYLLGLVVLKLSVVQYVEAEGSLRQERLFLTWTTTACSLIFGIVALVVGGWFFLVWAGGLLVAGLSVLGLLLHNSVELPSMLGGRALLPTLRRLGSQADDGSITSTWVAGVLGSALAFGGLLLFQGLFEGFWPPIAALIVLVILGAFFVLPGETVFGAVLLAMLVVWVAQDTDAATVDASNAAIAPSNVDAPWLVALGDSFISGEGASGFFADTNSPGSNDCRRAPTAYPQLVGAELAMPVLSFACSGATIPDLLTIGQKENSPQGVFGGEPQLDALSGWLETAPRPDVDIVLVSIGGNDAGFGDVIVACLTPGANCADAETAFMQRVSSLNPELQTVYTRLIETLEAADLPGGLPTILVNPYPDPIGEAGVDCNLVLGQQEAPFIRRFRSALNDQIEQAAATFDQISLASSEHSLVGHELCTDEPFANWLRLSPPDGPFLSSVNPNEWKNGSLHPAEGGHCTAALLILQDLGSDVPPAGFDCDLSAGLSQRLAPISTATPPICSGERPRDGLDCTQAWNDDALQNAARRVLVAAAVVIAAGMLLAGALTTHSPTQILPGWLQRRWTIIRRVWLDYDKVAHGRRAQERADPHSSPRM